MVMCSACEENNWGLTEGWKGNAQANKGTEEPILGKKGNAQTAIQTRTQLSETSMQTFFLLRVIPSIWHILSGVLSGISSAALSGILSGISSGILSGGWGPALPTEPVPALPTAIKNWRRGWQLRSSDAHCNEELARRRRRKRRRRRGRREELFQNLTALTWQVGKNAQAETPHDSANQLPNHRWQDIALMPALPVWPHLQDAWRKSATSQGPKARKAAVASSDLISLMVSWFYTCCTFIFGYLWYIGQQCHPKSKDSCRYNMTLKCQACIMDESNKLTDSTFASIYHIHCPKAIQTSQLGN